MSIDLDFSSMPSLMPSIRSWLASTLTSLPLPSFMGSLELESLDFGNVEPELELVDVVDVWKEFQEAEGEQISEDEDEGQGEIEDGRSDADEMHDENIWKSEGHGRSSPRPSHPNFVDHPLHSNTRLKKSVGAAPSSTSTPSLQLHFHFFYTGPISLSLRTSLLLNSPSPNFIALPIRLHIRGLVIQSEVIVALEGSKRRSHISLLPIAEDVPSSSSSNDEATSPSAIYSIKSSNPPLSLGERILPSILIDSEVGGNLGIDGIEGSFGGSILRNVGKVEKFVVELLRQRLEDEIGFPNFHTVLY